MVEQHTEVMTDEAVASATGKLPEDWFAILDAAGATEWKHPAIARWLATEHAVPPWWTQAITVRYEQARGLRLPGQQADGTFSVAASRTIDGEQREAIQRAIAAVEQELERPADTMSLEATYPSAQVPAGGRHALAGQREPVEERPHLVQILRERLASPTTSTRSRRSSNASSRPSDDRLEQHAAPPPRAGTTTSSGTTANGGGRAPTGLGSPHRIAARQLPPGRCGSCGCGANRALAPILPAIALALLLLVFVLVVGFNIRPQASGLPLLIPLVATIVALGIMVLVLGVIGLTRARRMGGVALAGLGISVGTTITVGTSLTLAILVAALFA